MAEHKGKDKTVLLMTSGKRDEETVVRIDRKKQKQVDKDKAVYVSNGPFTGIVVSKSETDLPTVKGHQVELDFTAYLLQNTNGHSQTQEQRLIRFWFDVKRTQKSEQIQKAQTYFKHLIKPERFPIDYVHFIKKAVSLARHFPSFTRIELILRPKPASSDEDEEEEDDVLEQARLRRLRVWERTKKWAKLDEGLSDDEDDGDGGDNILDNFITLITPAKYEYTYLPDIPLNNRRFFTFRVRARADVHIALSTLYGDTESKTYEILIGGWDNTKSVIRDGTGGAILEEALTVKILNQSMFKPFWVRWNRRHLEVGEGHTAGNKVILRCFLPHNHQYHINCLALTTGPGSPGEWELIEKLVPECEDENSELKKAKLKTVVQQTIWESKRRCLLAILEEAYPNSVKTTYLLRLTRTKKSDVQRFVSVLKELSKLGEIHEIEKDVWLMAHLSRYNKSHVVQMVDNWPKLDYIESPKLAIITSRMCEKIAIEHQMDNKTTYVKHTSISDCFSATLGRIDGRPVVHIKLPLSFTTQSLETLRNTLGHFRDVDQVFLVGVGGAVPNYMDYEQHVRLGDVVISIPSRDRRPVYIHGHKVGARKFGRYQYGVDTSWMSDDLLHGHVLKAMDMGESISSGFRHNFTKCVNQGVRSLTTSGMDFRRPLPKSDKLMGYADGEYGPIEHPSPPTRRGRSYKQNETNFRFGPVGSGKYLARNAALRMDFAQQYDLIAYDFNCQRVIEAIQKQGIESYLLIRGIADYVDGSVNGLWQPHAALCAAAYLRIFLTLLPKNISMY